MKTDLSAATIRTILTVVLTLSVILVLLYLLFRILQPFLFIFLTAFILSVFLSPLFEYCHKKLLLNKTVSAIITIFFTILVISIPLSIILTLLVSEVNDALFYIQTNYGIKNEHTTSVYTYLHQFGIPTQNIELEIDKYVVTALRFLLTNLTAILSQTVGLILNSILTLLVTFYFLIRKETILKYLYRINPLNQTDLDKLGSRAAEVMTATIRGNLIIITVQAMLGGLGFAIFGLSSPVLLGSLYGLVSLIPMVGITLVWLPAVFYLIFSGNLFGGVGLAIWCIGSNLFMDNFIGPKIVAGETRLHPLFILFGVLGGVQLFGFFGIIIGPTIVALSFIALEMYRQLSKG